MTAPTDFTPAQRAIMANVVALLQSDKYGAKMARLATEYAPLLALMDDKDAPMPPSATIGRYVNVFRLLKGGIQIATAEYGYKDYTGNETEYFCMVLHVVGTGLHREHGTGELQ